MFLLYFPMFGCVFLDVSNCFPALTCRPLDIKEKVAWSPTFAIRCDSVIRKVWFSPGVWIGLNLTKGTQGTVLYCTNKIYLKTSHLKKYDLQNPSENISKNLKNYKNCTKKQLKYSNKSFKITPSNPRERLCSKIRLTALAHIKTYQLLSVLFMWGGQS